MQNEGYRVIEASDGQSCLNAYEQMQPDLVLLDALIPVIDGFTYCAQIVESANRANISLPSLQAGVSVADHNRPNGYTPVLITALDDPQSVEQAFNAGASDYITKPIHWAVLRQRVRRLLEQAQLYKQLEVAN